MQLFTNEKKHERLTIYQYKTPSKKIRGLLIKLGLST